MNNTKKKKPSSRRPKPPRVPPRHTGKWCGKYYYKGVLWKGPTNLLGHGRMVLVGNDSGPCYIMPVG